VLLAQEANTIEYLTSARACGLEPFPEISILHLQALDAFRIDARAARCRLEHLHTRFRLQRTPPECRELVTKVPYELLQLLECLQLRTFAV
jgi:hypothetical protein